MFDPKTGIGGRNVTTAEGGTALLMCSIKHLGDNNTVSIDCPMGKPTLYPMGQKIGNESCKRNVYFQKCFAHFIILQFKN